MFSSPCQNRCHMSSYIAQGMMHLVHHASLPPWHAHLFYLIIRNDRCCKPLSLEMFHTLANFSSFPIPVCAEMHTLRWGGLAQGPRQYLGIKPAAALSSLPVQPSSLSVSCVDSFRLKQKAHIRLMRCMWWSFLLFFFKFSSLHHHKKCILLLVQYA